MPGPEELAKAVAAEHSSWDGPDEFLVCSGCGRRSSYDELRELADTRFTREVDMALARVRRVRERFPHRW